MTRRPWWDKPTWTRHVNTTPAASATRPNEERCGLTKAELAAWEDLRADLRDVLADHDAEVRQQPWRWTDWTAAGLGLLILLAYLIFGGSL